MLKTRAQAVGVKRVSLQNLPEVESQLVTDFICKKLSDSSFYLSFFPLFYKNLQSKCRRFSFIAGFRRQPQYTCQISPA